MVENIWRHQCNLAHKSSHKSNFQTKMVANNSPLIGILVYWHAASLSQRGCWATRGCWEGWLKHVMAYNCWSRSGIEKLATAYINRHGQNPTTYIDISTAFGSTIDNFVPTNNYTPFSMTPTLQLPYKHPHSIPFKHSLCGQWANTASVP